MRITRKRRGSSQSTHLLRARVGQLLCEVQHGTIQTEVVRAIAGLKLASPVRRLDEMQRLRAKTKRYSQTAKLAGGHASTATWYVKFIQNS